MGTDRPNRAATSPAFRGRCGVDVGIETFRCEQALTVGPSRGSRGVVTEPMHDPSGGNLKRTAQLYVLVPMFGTDVDPTDAMPCPNGGRPGELCGVALGNALLALFDHIPEAWRATPSAKTQCPDPNQAISRS